MMRASIQFHADPAELYSLLRETLREGTLTLVALRLRPFSVTRVYAESMEDVIATGYVNRWYMCSSEPSLACDNELEFSELNKNAIRLDIGSISSCGLGQSWLVCEELPEHKSEGFNRVFSRIRKMTVAGVTATNPVSGAAVKIKSFRYSQGAKQLAVGGVIMLPPAGNAIIRLGN